MAGDNNHILRLAGNFGCQVNHVLFTEGSRDTKLISLHNQARTLQRANDVLARPGQLRRARNARANFKLLLDMIHGTLAVERNRAGHHSWTRFSRTIRSSDTRTRRPVLFRTSGREK